MDTIYEGSWKSWAEVVWSFNGVYDFSKDEIKRKLGEAYPEPERVLYAEYGGGGYDGDAVVAYYDKGKFYTVEGGHGSCYGLEDQWAPEEYAPEVFLEVLDRRIANAYCEAGDYPSTSKRVWRLIKTRAEKLLAEMETPRA